MILHNGKQVTSVYIGDKTVSAVYCGPCLVWKRNSDTDAKFLRYWWSGSDPLVDGKLTDRMGSGIDWSIHGSPQWTGTEYVFDTTSKYGEYPETAHFDLGHHFRVVLDADLNPSIHHIPSAFFDIGSVIEAYKNIGFSCTAGGINVNWKMEGNNSNPGLGPSSDSTCPDGLAISRNGWTPVNVEITIRDRGNGYDECYVANNGFSHIYTADVPKVRYADFDNRPAYLSRGAAPGYGIGMRFRDLKVYVYD